MRYLDYVPTFNQFVDICIKQSQEDSDISYFMESTGSFVESLRMIQELQEDDLDPKIEDNPLVVFTTEKPKPLKTTEWDQLFKQALSEGCKAMVKIKGVELKEGKNIIIQTSKDNTYIFNSDFEVLNQQDLELLLKKGQLN